MIKYSCKCKIVLAFSCIVSLPVMQPHIAANGATMEERMSAERIQQLADQIETIKGDKEASHWQKIGGDVFQLQVASKQEDEAAWGKQKVQKLRLLLRLMTALHRSIDRNWDAQDVPQINIAPPGGLEGGRAGMDPASIKNPELRRQYEEAIRENAEKAERYRLQKGLRKLRDQWTKRLFVVVRTHFDLAEETDREQFEKLMEEELKDKELQQWLRGKFDELDKEYTVVDGTLIRKPQSMD